MPAATRPEPADEHPWPRGAGHGPGAADTSAADPTAAGSGHGQDALVPAGCQRPRLIVTVPLATLLRQPLAVGATILGPGTSLTAETARRLACDAEIIRLVTGPRLSRPRGAADPTTGLTQRLATGIAQLPPPLAGPSAVLDAGRKSAGWTPRQRDALATQYGGHCGHPRCTGPIDVIHHIVHWADGGPTSITNALPSCLYHHWLIHEGGWRVIKGPDGAITAIPPPPGWRPGTIYRRGTPLPEHTSPP